MAVDKSPGFSHLPGLKNVPSKVSSETPERPLVTLRGETLICAADNSEAQNRGYYLTLHTDWIVVRLLRRIRLPAESLPPIDKPLSARLLCSCGSMTHKSAPPCRINLRILDVLSSQH